MKTHLWQKRDIETLTREELIAALRTCIEHVQKKREQPSNEALLRALLGLT